MFLNRIHAMLAAAITVGEGGTVTSNGFFNGTIGELMLKIANALIVFTGALAVIMVIVGALRYVTSAGKPADTARAKDIIVYALVGVGAAIAAFAAVNFTASFFK